MAALYLHNAIHTTEPSDSPHNTASPHNRNISTVSSTTLHTSTSEHSHPTEPLLHLNTSESVAYLDLLSRQPPHPNQPRSTWSRALSLDGDPTTSRERKRFMEQSIKRCLIRLKIIKGSLETILGAFAVYNTVRYFLAYTIYDSQEGQTVSLAMGISTGSSFALLMCAVILSVFQPYLLVHQIPLRALLLARTVLHALSSFCLFGPAAVNVALTFIWKHSKDPELDLHNRCHVDIDVIWSVSDARCGPAAWGFWLALSLIRLAVTLFIVISYHMIATTYYHTQRPSRSRSRRYRHGAAHHANRSMSYQSSLTPSMTAMSSDACVIPQDSRRITQQQSSDSTLRSQTNSKYSSSNQQSLNSAHQAFTSTSSMYSDEERHEISYPSESEPLSPHNVPRNSSNGGNDHELISFVDRFRSLVSQITRETDEALEFARPDSLSTPSQPSDDMLDDFYPPNLPPALGYDEFGRPYPPEEHVPILNGYIRRMPTIESMGSREIGSMTTSSLHTNRDARTHSLRSTPPLSRPPTRNTMMSMSDYGMGSQPPSRTNSLTTGAEILVGAGRTSEVGELVGGGESNRDHIDGKRGSLASSGGLSGTGSSYPSTMSYYTATSYGSAAERGNSSLPTT